MVIGYTTGVFDMFHIGHLNILKRAKMNCDYLIVGVSTDELVRHDKNKTPIIPFKDRCAIVEAIRYVDKVVPQPDKNKMAAWEQYHFNRMFVGSDWKGTDTWNHFEKIFQPLGVEIVYFDYSDGISSTILREKLKNRKLMGGGNSLGVIGYTTGVYDMFHIGHLNIIKRAKEQCDFLVVGVSTDELVEIYKNKRPIIPYKNRAAIIASCRYVDAVVCQTSMDKFAAWNQLKFNVMFHGSEWQGTELYNRYEREFAKTGTKIVYLPHTDGISSTILRNRIINE